MNLLPTGTRASLQDQPTASVFDKLIAQFNKLFRMEHLPSGGHGLMSVQSLSLVTLTPPVINANTNNYTPDGFSTASYLRIASSGAVNLTGLVAPSTARVLWIRNVGAQNITFTHEDANSTPGYRFQLPNAASVVLGTLEGLQLVYDPIALRWGTVQQ